MEFAGGDGRVCLAVEKEELTTVALEGSQVGSDGLEDGTVEGHPVDHVLD